MSHRVEFHISKAMHDYPSSRYAGAVHKALRPLQAGKIRLLISIPLYRCWWRLRGLDFHVVSIQKLKLNPERAKECKDGGGPLLQDFLDQLSIEGSDCVLDLGSGKGGRDGHACPMPVQAR